MTKPQLPQGFDFTDPDVYAARLPTEELRQLRQARLSGGTSSPLASAVSPTAGTGW